MTDRLIRGASVDVEKSWFDFGGFIAEYVESFDKTTSCQYAAGVEKTPCLGGDEWCASGPGRFTYSYSSAGTYYPELRLLVGDNSICIDVKDKTTTVVVK